MQREIIFRAWDGYRSEMVYFPDGFYGFYHNESVTAFDYKNNGDYYELELMQFTGLSDKNGDKIFEGDILSDNTYVVFKDGIFGTTYEGNNQGVSRLSAKRCKFLEKIGTIHDDIDTSNC